MTYPAATCRLPGWRKSARDACLPRLVFGTIEKIVWHNPIQFFAQTGRLDPAELDAIPAIDRTQTFETHRVTRG